MSENKWTLQSFPKLLLKLFNYLSWQLYLQCFLTVYLLLMSATLKDCFTKILVYGQARVVWNPKQKQGSKILRHCLLIGQTEPSYHHFLLLADCRLRWTQTSKREIRRRNKKTSGWHKTLKQKIENNNYIQIYGVCSKSNLNVFILLPGEEVA